jgi:glutamate N-acetyltransferase/amino-acid N-acetyltransferase
VQAGLAEDAWAAAADAIMTTDTFPKGATRTALIDGVPVTINGIAKGAGMIAPDMATMLAFVFTDAALPHEVLQPLLAKGADASFNCITVDSDTSTSDTLLLFATGQARHARITEAKDRRLADFKDKLNDLLLDLALQVVRDGEGATKFVKVEVRGAAGNRAARRIAMAIANSPLVKTAIAGEDANWGRIVMAVGKAGEKADRDRLAIRIGGVEVARDGQAVPDYDETPVTAHMKGRHIALAVDIGIGKGKATVWTCDLTHGYIDINGSYRT